MLDRRLWSLQRVTKNHLGALDPVLLNLHATHLLSAGFYFAQATATLKFFIQYECPWRTFSFRYFYFLTTTLIYA